MVSVLKRRSRKGIDICAQGAPPLFASSIVIAALLGSYLLISQVREARHFFPRPLTE